MWALYMDGHLREGVPRAKGAVPAQIYLTFETQSRSAVAEVAMDKGKMQNYLCTYALAQ